MDVKELSNAMDILRVYRRLIYEYLHVLQSMGAYRQPILREWLERTGTLEFKVMELLQAYRRHSRWSRWVVPRRLRHRSRSDGIRAAETLVEVKSQLREVASLLLPNFLTLYLIFLHKEADVVDPFRSGPMEMADIASRLGDLVRRFIPIGVVPAVVWYDCVRFLAERQTGAPFLFARDLVEFVDTNIRLAHSEDAVDAVRDTVAEVSDNDAVLQDPFFFHSWIGTHTAQHSKVRKLLAYLSDVAPPSLDFNTNLKKFVYGLMEMLLSSNPTADNNELDATPATELLSHAEEFTGYLSHVVAVCRFPREVAEEPPPPPAIGLESKLEEVGSYLRDSGVGIIGVWGSGGVGKSTLLRCIERAFIGTSDFHLVMYVEASKSFDLLQLQREIAERLDLNLPDYAGRTSLANAIFNFLETKGFLLLLDDLWEAVDLGVVGIPHLGGSVRCNRKLVFTTRSGKVCDWMGAHKRIKLGCLGKEEAWSLFKDKVGEDAIRSDEKSESLARQAAEGCGGLPLAIVTIAGTMSASNEINKWENICKMLQKSQMDEATGDKVFPTLRLSYDSLQTDEMRRSFLCCSYWADTWIDVDELIECWMGMGLIGSFDNMDEAYLKGHLLIKRLKDICLLEPVDDDHEDDGVKIHPITRSLALWIASDDGKSKNKWIVPTPVGTKKVIKKKKNAKKWRTAEQISLMDQQIKELPPALSDCPSLQTLILRRNPDLVMIPGRLARSMSRLAYLDLSLTSVKALPPEIGLMRGMKYLNLSRTPISSLPSELGDLTQLRYLHLAQTRHLRTIARGVFSKLSMLTLLNLYRSGYADWESEDSGGFEDLFPSERSLKALGITLQTESALQRLLPSEKSSIPVWWLCITGLEQSKSLGLSPALLWSLSELRVERCISLKELIMNGGDTEGEVEDQEREVRVPPLTILENLQLYGLQELERMEWMGVESREFFPRLRYLEISSCHSLKSISWVAHLNLLEKLTLFDCKEMEQVIDDSEDSSGKEVTTFPSLRKLSLKRLPKLHRMCDPEVEFPCLVCVEVVSCPELKIPQSQLDAMEGKLQTVPTAAAT